VAAGGKKFAQARRSLRDGIGLDDSSDVKACRARGGDQLCLKRGEI
jgi:hypothetical protein